MFRVAAMWLPHGSIDCCCDRLYFARRLLFCAIVFVQSVIGTYFLVISRVAPGTAPEELHNTATFFIHGKCWRASFCQLKTVLTYFVPPCIPKVPALCSYSLSLFLTECSSAAWQRLAKSILMEKRFGTGVISLVFLTYRPATSISVFVHNCNCCDVGV